MSRDFVSFLMTASMGAFFGAMLSAATSPTCAGLLFSVILLSCPPLLSWIDDRRSKERMRDFDHLRRCASQDGVPR